MCRFLLCKGREPILIAELLTRPAHSIINQSFDCRLRIDRIRPINGDGFGVGWYDASAPGESPCIFTSIQPAWNNLNLSRLVEKIRSPLVFAHVRASTGGFPSSESNCHPWQYGRLMWMHNGNIANFGLIKRRLQASLRDSLYNFVQGNTDSEWSFALFLNQLDDPDSGSFTPEVLKEAMLRTIAQLNQWLDEAGITEISLMNFAVTDGESVICTRYITDSRKEGASLYFSSGTRFESYKPGHYRMIKADKREDIVVIASEPLTFEKTDWLTIPSNTLVIITPRLNVLLHPIKDQYYTANKREAWS
ncbi:nucleophile aminohydrolase [Thamnocephalis sphaerospora]|uniref:Nucleophile aminohydrolase n=1 Tax=Thamnocephalis sphaerospora TaxID=78915 RepID=A0A4V1IXH2_9FUNG|nr:nucleophile aminohydrolase [Thamnocephalis sphaerospora]|eukprot:RKP11049.1 nucleophile aminohydrolase [Thamnocephalis sphaerospora]